MGQELNSRNGNAPSCECRSRHEPGMQQREIQFLAPCFQSLEGVPSVLRRHVRPVAVAAVVLVLPWASFVGKGVIGGSAKMFSPFV